MHASVRNNFSAFSKRLEGRVNHMYLDSLLNVTIAVGNKIDPVADALALASLGAPLLRDSDNARASDAEITTEWTKVKGGSTATTLHLSEASIDALVAKRLQQNETVLLTIFPGFDDWPADAQLGILSMAWGLGANALRPPHFKELRAAIGARKWFKAARECNMNGSGLLKRNAVNRGLFRNAAVSAEPPASDPAVLFLPIPGNRPKRQLGDGPDDAHVALVQRMFNPDRLNHLTPGTFTPGTFDAATLTAVKAFQSGEAALPGSGTFPVTGVVAELTWACLGEHVPQA
ncbi:peptidoglycan-binding domain-containing protein [Streptomyces sp. NPDC018338]|uniref:peptidoglycan-binding domain-containing protein n=1 Tax=Streptomyces sp. NPDC018338 TaxID=3157192 RepID=UPI0033D71139